MSHDHSAAPGPVRPELRRLRHTPALDGLRGVAVLLILVYHTLAVLVPPEPVLIPDWMPGGFLGVDLFFVLSGFLITALLLTGREDRGRVHLASFYRARALRLLPALVVFLAAHMVYATVTDLPQGLERSTVLSSIFYYLNWKIVWDFAVADGLGHLWSLAVEEQFYLLWPILLICLLMLRRWRWAAPVAVSVAVAAVAVHRIQLWDSGEPFLFLYVRTDTRADSLLIGCLLAFLWTRRLTPQRGLVPAAWVATAFFAACIALAPVDAAFLYLGGFTAVALAGATIVLAVVESSWSMNRVLRTKPLRAVGRVSYGLYLWHLAVFSAVARYGQSWPSGLRVLAGLGITAALTLASWFVIERPALGWKRRLESRSRRPAQDVTVS